MGNAMADASRAGQPFALGDWEVDPLGNRLNADGREVRLEPKLMAVLAYLARAHGRIVTKDELLERVWPRRYVVEGVLKRAVSELRRSLGDDARSPRYIETVYKVGYRLVTMPAPLPPAGGGRIVTGSRRDIVRALARLGAGAHPHGTLTLIIAER